MNRKILHIDINAFYASCEQLKNPNLQGKPIAVGRLSERSVLTTANYLARQYGVGAGMSVRLAIQKCPQLQIIEPDMQYYRIISKKFIEILKQYTLFVEQASIDEAYIDITHLNASAYLIAKEIMQEIKHTLNLDCSIGVSFCKYLAKLGSDLHKPARINVLNQKNYLKILGPRSIETAKFIGKKTIPKLHQLGVKTIDDFLQLDEMIINQLNSKNLKQIRSYLKGQDYRKVVKNELTKQKSIGLSKTFLNDINDQKELKKLLQKCFIKIMNEVVNRKIKAKTITITIRYANFKTHSISKTFAEPIENNIFFAKYIQKLFEQLWQKRAIRLIGIQLSNFENSKFNKVQIIEDYL